MAAEHFQSVRDADLDALIRELARVDPVPLAVPDSGPQAYDASRFRILQRLGAGGFGVVYLVRDLATESDVALKTLPVARPELIYRLKREFRVLADLRHQNLVSFHELFAEGDRVYFTMEYVPGASFLKHVRRADGFDEQRLRASLAQLATGLSVLHAAGKLHRDVKPSNVLVSPEGRVVLLDFGLATEIEPRGVSRSAEAAGTPEYMSPEHARGEPLSGASDWYSVGIMLYQALTGRLPFRGSFRQLIEERRRDPASPREMSAAIPEDLSRLCMSLLSHDVSGRAGAREISSAVGGGWAAPAPRTSAASERPLYGREPELAELDLALASVRAGQAATILVEGNSGVGKTALVERFLAKAAQEDGAVVFRGRCYERERVPYQGIDSLIDDVCHFLDSLDAATAESFLPRHLAALVRLFPVIERVPAVAARIDRTVPTSVDGREIRRLAFGAFRELLARIGDRRRLTVHIDDLQWGDPDTAALLRDLIRPPDAPPMALVLAYRTEDRERSPCLRALAQDTIAGATRIRLDPLPPTAAEALLRSLLAAPEKLDVARLAGEAGGNPFLIQEVARFAPLMDESGAGAAGLDVAGVLRARVGRLPSTAQALLRTVAVAGQPITEQIVRRAARFAGPAWDVWRELVAEHLVRFSGPPDERYVEAFHDRIRESVVAGLAPEQARECHAGLAEALDGAGAADPEVLAQHHETAGNLDRARALTVQAASKARKALAFDRAARLLRHALELAPGDHPQRAALLTALGEALSNAGRCVEAASVYLEAGELEAPLARTHLRRRAAEQLLFAGKVDAGRELLQQDLPAQGFALARTSGRAILSFLVRRAIIQLRGLGFRRRGVAEVDPELLSLLHHTYNVTAGMSMIDAAHGADIGSRFVLRALDAGEPLLVGRALSVLAGYDGAESPFSARARRILQQMRDFAREVDDRSIDGIGELVSTIHEYFSGNWPAALRHGDDADRIISAEAQGLVWELWTCRSLAIWSLFFLGRWEELEQRVHVHLRQARERGNAYAACGVISPFGVAAWLRRDQPGEARRELREVSDAWSVKGFQFQHYWFLMAESLVSLYSGDGAGAWAHVQERWKSLAGSLTMRFPIAKTKVLHTRGACALAAATQLRRGSAAHRSLLAAARRTARRLERVRLPPAAPFAALLRAGIDAQAGRLEHAERGLQDAIRKLEAAEMNVYAAAARRRLARMRHEPPPEFLSGESVTDPDAVARMLAPGFSG